MTGTQLTFIENSNIALKKAFIDAYFAILQNPPEINAKDKQSKNDIKIKMAVLNVSKLFNLRFDEAYTILFPRKT